jgi:hypothetical protein
LSLATIAKLPPNDIRAFTTQFQEEVSMNNLNRDYKASPTHFLSNHVLTMNPSIQGALRDPRELVTGIEHFDIRPLPYPGGTELKFYMDAGQAQHIGDRQVGMGGRLGEGGSLEALAARVPMLQAIGVIWRPAANVRPEPREAPIKAYWLPYEADKTYETILGADANYFFTAGLSGCCVMVSGDPTAPRVAHINRTEAGSATFQKEVAGPRAIEEALARRRAMAQGEGFTSRTGKEAQTNRQIMFQELKSKVAAREARRDTRNDLLGYCKWGEQYRDLCGVVGIRNQATGVWAFHYQCYRNVGAPPNLAALGFITQRDGPLKRMA